MNYEWIEFFREVSDWIADYEDKQLELIQILQDIGVEGGFEDELIENVKTPLEVMEPFSFFAMIMKYGDTRRARCFKALAQRLNLDSTPPTDFSGVPMAQAIAARLFPMGKDRPKDLIENLWELFRQVRTNQVNGKLFNSLLTVHGIGLTKLTQYMFYIAPEYIFPVDRQTESWLEKNEYPWPKNWDDYTKLMANIRQKYKDKPFYEISYEAWASNKDEKEKNSKPTSNSIPNTINEESAEMKKINKKEALNQILYGPPGTGKTYSTREQAVRLADPDWMDRLIGDDQNEQIKQRYDELVIEGRIAFVSFHQSFSYEDFIEGIQAKTGLELKQYEEDGELVEYYEETGQLVYQIESGVFKALVETIQEQDDASKNYVLIIDEINRGNISRIFGELITLLEEDKRQGGDDERSVVLPYSKDYFTVPNNLYVLGTMNTADKSLAQLDLALRRRFEFIEMLPEPEQLKDVWVYGVNIGQLLNVINQRIEVLLGRDYLIGHAYFWALKKEQDENRREELLASIFEKKIIPLLQEYFFADWERIAWVLNDYQAKDENSFIQLQQVGGAVEGLFAKEIAEQVIDRRYRINKSAFTNPEAYQRIIANSESESE